MKGNFEFVYKMAARGSLQGGSFFWIFRGFQLRETEKTKDVNGEDPYEIPRNAWKDDVDSWPNLTHTLRDVSSKNPHTEDQLMN